METKVIGNKAAGINVFHGEAYVSNSTLIRNKGRNAGGIGLFHSEAHVINSTLTGNQGEGAGGIGLLNSEASVVSTTLTGNKGREGGALASLADSHPTTERCSFHENIAIDTGGAVYVNEAEYQDSNSVFTDNVGGEGGKIKQDACN